MTENRNVYLIGPMGSGKTAVGRQLAKLLHLDFHDSDVEVERRTGVDIPYIFEKEGEAGFREREREVIDSLTQLSNVIIARPSWRMLFMQVLRRDASRAALIAGSKIAIKIAIMAITTRSSTNVKPRAGRGGRHIALTP